MISRIAQGIVLTGIFASKYELIRNQPGAITVGKVWVDGNMKGPSEAITITTLPSDCINFNGQFQDSISSIQINSGIECSFFLWACLFRWNKSILLTFRNSDLDCIGAALGVFGSVSNLVGTNFMDTISSVKCQSSTCQSLSSLPTWLADTKGFLY